MSQFHPALPELWAMMLAAFGHRWESAQGRHPDGVAAGVWTAGLVGITEREVASACHRMLTQGDGWPPSLPEFRAMCLQVPSFAEVKRDLANASANRMQFTRLAWEYVDGYQHKQAPADKADRMLRDAYEQARDHVMAGGSLPEPVMPVGYEGELPVRPADPGHAARCMDEAREALGL